MLRRCLYTVICCHKAAMCSWHFRRGWMFSGEARRKNLRCKTEPSDRSACVLPTVLSIHLPHFWRAVFVKVVGSLLASERLQPSFFFGWLILIDRQACTPATPVRLRALGWNNCHVVWIDHRVYFYTKACRCSRHAVLTLAACGDVKKHHSFWRVGRLDLPYFFPGPVIISCLIILERKPLEYWPLI